MAADRLPPGGDTGAPPLCRVQLWKEDLYLVDLVDLCLADVNGHKDIFRRIFSEELF